jgi:hypothetical protein
MKTQNLNAYGVFILAMMIIKGREGELDLVWEEACAHYDVFLDSHYNDAKRSEMDCIAEYVVAEYLTNNYKQ